LPGCLFPFATLASWRLGVKSTTIFLRGNFFSAIHRNLAQFGAIYLGYRSAFFLLLMAPAQPFSGGKYCRFLTESMMPMKKINPELSEIIMEINDLRRKGRK